MGSKSPKDRKKSMISVTTLSSYLYCKRKLFLERVMGLAEPPKEALVLGSLRHEVYERINNAEESVVLSIEKGVSAEEIMMIYKQKHSQILRNAIINYRSRLERFGLEMDDVFRKVWNLVSNESETRANNVIRFVEDKNVFGEELWGLLTPKIKSEYRIESEELGIKGIIDQIEVHKSFVLPIELKTGSMPAEGVWPGHRIQLAAYILLLRSNGIDINEGKVVYLDKNESRTITMNPFLEQEIKELIDNVNNLLCSQELPMPCSNKNKCSACGLKKECFDNEKLQKQLETGLRSPNP